jgi:hypothetical protein
VEEEMGQDEKKKDGVLFGHVFSFLNFVTSDDNTFLSSKAQTNAKR